MAFKLENVWESMKSNNYQTVNEIGDEMLCILCKKLLINAQSAPCGCRFCFICISEYLCEKKLHCPGITDDCKREIISKNDNIVVDHPTNVRISKLIVKCPEVSCEFQSELRNMEDHTRICIYKSLDCPYSNIGCDKWKIPSDKLLDHLQSEILNHTKLLINFVGNFNNEINALKKSNNDLREDNQMLKNEIFEWKSNYERRQVEIEELKADVICLKDDDFEIKANMNRLTLDVKNNKNGLIELRRIRDKDTHEMRLSNKEQLNLKNELNTVKSNMKQNKTAIQNTANIIENTHNNDNSMKNFSMKLSEIEITQNQMFNGEFVWRIDNFRDKLKKAKIGTNQIIYSKYFYSHKNGYNMCLRMDPDGSGNVKGKYLSLFYCLMKSDFDDILEWPFKHSVKLELINQRTRLPHCTDNLVHNPDSDCEAYCRPVRKYGSPVGFYAYISHTELLGNKDLLMNNQIFIKCTVNVR